MNVAGIIQSIKHRQHQRYRIKDKIAAILLLAPSAKTQRALTFSESGSEFWKSAVEIKPKIIYNRTENR